MQHRRRIGQAGRLDHRAGEIGHPPLDPVDEQIGQRVDDVAAHRAAQAAAVQQYDILGRAFDQQVVEADLAELVDDDRGRRHAGLLQHVVQQRRLAAAEKPGQHRHRNARQGVAGRHVTSPSYRPPDFPAFRMRRRGWRENPLPRRRAPAYDAGTSQFLLRVE